MNGQNYRGQRINQHPSGAWFCKASWGDVFSGSLEFVKSLIDSELAGQS